MSGDHAEREVGVPADAGSDSSGDDALKNEADVGRQDFDQEKARLGEAKKGRSITGDFGKPEIKAEPRADQPMGAPNRADATKKVEQAGVVTLEPVVIYGEVYHGEPEITRTVDAKCQQVSKEETLENIAKDQLGKEATKKEIDAYIKELAKVNELGDPPTIKEGQMLKRPGHTADGGFVTVDDKGEKTTRWSNGNLRIDHADKSYKLIEYLRGDSWRETHGGHDRPEENFALIKDKMGHFKLDDGNILAPAPFELLAGFDYSKTPEHQELEHLAEEKIQDPERLAKFRADMLRFEDRIKYMRGDSGLPGLEIGATYDQIKRLLDAPAGGPLTEDQRITLAEQVLSQCASPRSIDQGTHNTCNVTTIESRYYTQNPAGAAKLVADVAGDGKYNAHGTEVSFDSERLQPDKDASKNPPIDGGRSYASQLFQVTLVNLSLQMHKAEGSWQGKYVYEQYKPGDIDGTGKKVGSPPNDSGERQIDYSKDPPEERRDDGVVPIRKPDLSDDDIVNVVTALTGESKFDPIFIEHKMNAGDSQLPRKIESEAELLNAIKDASRLGTMPVIVGVNSHLEPFWSDSDGQLAAGAQGAHVITITGYDAGPPARVAIDNQWGSHSDHGATKMVPLHELYLAMKYPNELSAKNNAAKVEQEMKDDIDKGDASTTEKLQYLRLTNDDPGSTAYKDKLIECMLEEQKRFKKSDDPYSAGDHERAIKTFQLMLSGMPPYEQEAVVDRLLQGSPDDPGLLSERERIKNATIVIKIGMR